MNGRAPIEAVENLIEFVGRNRLASVRYVYLDPPIQAAHMNTDRAARVGVFQGIVGELLKRQFNQPSIYSQRRDRFVTLNLDGPLVNFRAQFIDSFSNDFLEVRRFRMNLNVR